MARQKAITPATAFSATLRSALEHVADPAWLGHRSPLASPYFLGGGVLSKGQPGPEERGRLLQSKIYQAATAMWAGPLPHSRQELVAAADGERATLGSHSSRYRFVLLELRYFRRFFSAGTFPAAVEAMPGFLNVSPTRFFIHLEEAIDELGSRLLEFICPALRLESPSPLTNLIGRDGTVSEVLHELEAGLSVAITGMGGIGKTAAGAAVAARWPGAVFWHTFHPGLNDDLSSILFNLGHFLHAEGAPSLWAQLMAAEGRIGPPAQVIGMLRMDLEAIAPRRPLLCFDEFDILHTATGEPRRKQHAQLLGLLESLLDLAPLLFIGQRVYLDTKAHHGLEPLPPNESFNLLRAHGLELSSATTMQVHAFTHGTPRLLELYVALRKSGEDDEDLLALPHGPSAQPLFSRLWRRLDDIERDLLGTLSVFRSNAPADAFAEALPAMAGLRDRNLIKTDLSGGIGLLPFVRELVYGALPESTRRRYHGGAALVRGQMGSFTAAAYHYLEAGVPATAISVWYAHQEQEVLAGQAGAAAEVFSRIDRRSLDPQIDAELRVILNRLALLDGESERVLEGMDGFKWEADTEAVAEAIGQWATAYELRDQTDLALSHYDEAIHMLSRLTTKLSAWHLRRGFVFLDASDAQAARHQAQLATYDVLRLLGMIDYTAGNFAAARQHFLTALQIAETARDTERTARANMQLSLVEGQAGNIDEASRYAEQAMEHFAATGNRMQLEGLRAELAGCYLNIRRFDAVIEPAEKALAFFERIKHDRWVASISSNLAEAYMELGRLEEARARVFQVLRSEITQPRPYALYTLGHIHAREGNPPYAETSFREGIEISRANGDPFIEAYLWRALGILLRDDEREAEAVIALEEARALFARMGLAHEHRETEALLAPRAVQDSSL